jgi:hypothetical protein
MDELHPAPDIFQDMRRTQKALWWKQTGSLWSWALRMAQYLSFRAGSFLIRRHRSAG